LGSEDSPLSLAGVRRGARRDRSPGQHQLLANNRALPRVRLSSRPTTPRHPSAVRSIPLCSSYPVLHITPSHDRIAALQCRFAKLRPSPAVVEGSVAVRACLVGAVIVRRRIVDGRSRLDQAYPFVRSNYDRRCEIQWCRTDLRFIKSGSSILDQTIPVPYRFMSLLLQSEV
jgi:hypothetical protein